MTETGNVTALASIGRGVRKLVYTYDMGDDWRHTVPGKTVDVRYSHFVAGKPRCPPEAVGGLAGFEVFIDAMAASNHEEREHLHERYGGPNNAGDIDERFTRRAIAAIAIHRIAGKLAYQKRPVQ